MPLMIATSEIEYPPGKIWQPGESFPVEEGHTQLLIVLGRAKLAEQQEVVAAAPPRGRGRAPPRTS